MDGGGNARASSSFYQSQQSVIDGYQGLATSANGIPVQGYTSGSGVIDSPRRSQPPFHPRPTTNYSATQNDVPGYSYPQTEIPSSSPAVNAPRSSMSAGIVNSTNPRFHEVPSGPASSSRDALAAPDAYNATLYPSMSHGPPPSYPPLHPNYDGTPILTSSLLSSAFDLPMMGPVPLVDAQLHEVVLAFMSTWPKDSMATFVGKMKLRGLLSPQHFLDVPRRTFSTAHSSSEATHSELSTRNRASALQAWVGGGHGSEMALFDLPQAQPSRGVDEPVPRQDRGYPPPSHAIPTPHVASATSTTSASLPLPSQYCQRRHGTQLQKSRHMHDTNSAAATSASGPSSHPSTSMKKSRPGYCVDCKDTETTQWRTHPVSGNQLCNGCGQRARKAHGRQNNRRSKKSDGSP
ncbi:hypothetical protein MSAN_01729400 [Mycena sanguinolenta]|uniref:GATA-type domain-containing protein n=1 Tax=Mycena sanguinolenta TaxID=230812 RepID=A0A8H6XZG6_9AGAR|nr:hypothetical protein MSAN_01729400 [Mycena sanguinolenta]